ncbi:MAG TPA: FAD-binding protein, partial [Streptosporangiaceae bacterium]
MTASSHEVAVASVREAYAALPPGAPVRLAKRTSNLFRFRDAQVAGASLDLSAFDQVIRVDPAGRTARVGGMTTYEDLADATLRHRLMP